MPETATRVRHVIGATDPSHTTAYYDLVTHWEISEKGYLSLLTATGDCVAVYAPGEWVWVGWTEA